MSETMRRMKANRVVVEKPCGWCQAKLLIGEDAAICACGNTHHASCWDEKGGCAGEGCAHAPLKQMAAAPEPQAALPPHLMLCPHCGRRMAKAARICLGCKMAPTPDGAYRGPMQRAPAAGASLTYAIIGFFILGFILGPLAIIRANEARRQIATNPSFDGGGMATAGLVIGIIDILSSIAFWVIKAGRA